jgi:RimK family alpha-L-glutamate ligase
MNLSILSENKGLHGTRRLCEEAQKRNVPFEVTNPYLEKITIPQSSRDKLANSLVIHRITGIKFDDYDLAYSSHLENQGATIFNPLNILKTFRDKELQALTLSSNDLPVIPSYSFRGRPTEKTIDEISNLFSSFNTNEKFVLKSIRGNQGIGVNLIEGTNSLFSILETFWAIKDQKFILQPYLQGGREFRIFTTGSEILGSLEKKKSDFDFRNNLTRSEARYLTDSQLSSKIKNTVEKIIEKTNIEYAGIDLIELDDYIFILEVNPVPGFKQIEETGKINIAGPLLSYLINAYKR